MLHNQEIEKKMKLKDILFGISLPVDAFPLPPLTRMQKMKGVFDRIYCWVWQKVVNLKAKFQKDSKQIFPIPHLTQDINKPDPDTGKGASELKVVQGEKNTLIIEDENNLLNKLNHTGGTIEKL